jgi:ubiquinone/menaquinone biosynthesis C-methylase UbiE
MTNATMEALPYTGERMVPEQTDAETFWEHIYRYRFAAGCARNRRVLDIACGEGYGTRALIEAGAARAIGVDISADACAHARRRYGVDARVGSAEAIPLPDRAIDLVVSFETIEHVSRPHVFLDECARVLAPGGLVIVSTPNRSVYRRSVDNPFHCSEMDEEEFRNAVGQRFVQVEVFSQRPMTAAWWSPRSWAAQQSVWNQVRGVWRLRSVAWPHLFGERAGDHRPDPVAAVLATDRAGASWLNPYTVRRHRRWMAEQPMYLIAVGRKGERP